MNSLVEWGLKPIQAMQRPALLQVYFCCYHTHKHFFLSTPPHAEERARAIEHMLITLSSKGGLPTAVVSKAGTGSSSPDGSDGLSLSDGMATLAQILDISLLKFQDRDRLVEVLQRYRQSSEYDMVKAWDARSRKWYGDRYDARRNMIDWDYHMPLLSAGTPGQDPSHGSIIHFHHFRWDLLTRIDRCNASRG